METKFAQRLAANEQPKRNRAVKRLKTYISTKAAKAGFSQAELLQLWKGLHYCFWMQDKPLLQEELSGRLCGLLKAFPDAPSALEFAAAFFTTQAREWGRLDQWRVDKFMMLIRDFLHATFEVLAKNRWEETLVGQTSALIGAVMDAEKEDFPDGFRLHLADIYLEELEKSGSEELSGELINVLLQPFLQYVVHSKRDVIASKVSAKVFGVILQTTQTENVEDGEERETPNLQFNYQGLQKALFDAGRQKNVLPKVRRKIYKLVKRFSVLGVEGTQSAALAPAEHQQPGKRKQPDPEEEEPQRKKKKTIKTVVVVDSEEADQADTSAQDAVQTPSQQRKKKKIHKKDTAGSASRHVAFDLERNSSRGLKEFVMSATSPSCSPYLPSRSPTHGILKDSPSAGPSPGVTKKKSGPSSSSGDGWQGKKSKHFKKGETVARRDDQQSAALSTTAKGKKSLRGEQSSKFASKKKGKTMKKPKRR
ncbi:ribosomal RNA processing protein 1 homolog [Babylonia areolata]|uniref:ribosomal RNA processing protein 1 homolog n=1 Tax=Babylonia areolata TaxID=304850 RepID=UPI003FD5CEBD